MGLIIGQGGMRASGPNGDAAPPDRHDGGQAAVVALVLVALALSIPILSHRLLPFTDYVNNLARAHVIATISTDADLQRFYVIDWRVIPNLMMDLVVPALSRIVGLYPAGQAFTLAALGLILSGSFALHRALFGRWSVAPAAAGIIIYNEVLLVGVMNYVFGIGLALWALTCWIALRERAWPWRFALSTLFVVALFFCHLFALGLYGLGLLAFELHRLWTVRDGPLPPRLLAFTAAGLPFLAAAILLVASPTVDLAGEIVWEPWGKLDGLLLLFTVYHYSVAAFLIVSIALTIVWLAWRGAIVLHPVGWMLLMVGGAVYLAMPRTLFATHLADQRLPVAVAFMLLACIDLDLRRRSVRLTLAAVLVALLGVRLVEVQHAWNKLSRQSASFLHAAQSVERGTRILVVHADRDQYSADASVVSDFNLLHAASLATIERAALVSTNFVVSGKHVLQVREPYRRLVNRDDRVPPSVDALGPAAALPDQPDGLYWSQWPRHFDYVFVLFTRPGDVHPDLPQLASVADAAGFRLYRVIRP